MKHFINETGLRCGDEDGAAYGLEEEHDRRDRAEVGWLDSCLANDDGDLDGEAEADSDPKPCY